MSHMFDGATSFNQVLNWNVSENTNVNNMFGNSDSFGISDPEIIKEYIARGGC